MALGIITGVSVGLSGTSLMARLRGNAGELVTQATFSTITYVVTNLTAGTSAAAVSLTVNNVIFNALQQADPRWTVDSVDRPGPDGSYGYNFLVTIPASSFPVAVAAVPTPVPVQFQVDVIMTPATGEAWRVPYQIAVLPVYG